MTITNCPKCGSTNITTAGVCANCGWSQFAQVMGAGENEEAVYELVGEIEIKMTGKALLDDYKRLLFENRNLKERVAELEALVERLIEAGDRLSDSLCTYPEEDKTIEVMSWNAIVAEYKERER